MRLEPDGVFDAAAPRYFSIAPGEPFLKTLAQSLRASIAKKSGVDLADAVIYLPTRRAVRALSEAFVETSPHGRASLLPRIRALGDIDEDEFLVFAGAAEDEIDLPPAISPAQRRLALAKLVAEKDKAFFDGQRRWAGAISAADALGKLLDSLYAEEVDPSRLESIVPDALAEHWRGSVEFLTIVTQLWPAFLQEQGLTDPADRRVKLIDRQSRRWRETPPQTPIVIAGTTGSTPAVARMMKTAAAAPMGCVVLPGLDRASAPHVWSAVDETHPQSGMKALLRSLDVARGDIRAWPRPRPPQRNIQNRSALFTVAMRPADASDDWRDWAEAAKADDRDLGGALSGVELVEARDEDFEAAVIALKMREAVEDKDTTVMLATPDRDLARRVSMKMKRWGVVVDDSAGVPFANTPCGTFLRLTAQWLSDVADPVALTAMLDHPMFGGGLSKSDRRRATASLDRALRGLRPPSGAAGLARLLETFGSTRPQAVGLVQMLMGLARLQPSEPAAFADRFAAHIAVAEALAATAQDEGAARLWRGDDGETGAAWLAQLQDGLGCIVHDRPEDYASIFTRLIAAAVVRRRAPAHPRLAILGPLEARLQTADIVILGGLNEGVWPRDAAIDPFLSRPMRAALGLPSPERRIGLAAHDFIQLAAAPAVMLTRATRSGGKPAKPSRWIVRLKNVLKGAGALALIEQTRKYDVLAQRLDAPETIKQTPAPQPRPPLAARPTQFFVTHVEKLMRDPYSIYARRILRLEKLEALDETFGPHHIGNLLHKIAQEYADRRAPETSSKRIDLLRALFERYAATFGLTQTRRAFWNARLNEAFERFAAWDASQRAAGEPLVVEGRGAFGFEIDGRAYGLSARADRIDALHDGGACVIDYKSGTTPTLKQIKSHFSPQLPLTGLIVREGGFDALGATPVNAVKYVRLLARAHEKNDDVGASGDDCARLIEEARQGLCNLLRHFTNPDAAYPSQPRAQYADDYGDYDHLARRRERNAQRGEA